MRNMDKEELLVVTLRVPMSLVGQMDKIRNKLSLSRNSWILELIKEKLKGN